MSRLHEFYMRRCLELALLGQGRTHPNPMVGCVVLDEHGVKVGEGFHLQAGGPHAEAGALRQAGEKARGGTLYVSLEPCNHQGKTPPCTQAIVQAGVKAVYYGVADPNPKVAGGGAKALTEAGVTVVGDILPEECRRINEAFFHAVNTGRPYVILKQAITLDGKIATRSGESRWITGPQSRRWVHQLRSQCDGILTTAETVAQDDSELTIREAPSLGTPPVRIILDRKMRLNPQHYRIFKPVQHGGPVWVFTSKSNTARAHARRAAQQDFRVFEVGENGQGLDLEQMLSVLGAEGISQLMVEAGGTLAGALIRQRLVQKIWLLYGDQLVMDPAAKPGFVGTPQFFLGSAPAMTIQSGFRLENNWVLEAYPSSSPGDSR